MGVKLTEWRLKLSENILSTLSKADAAFDKTKAKAADFNSQLNSNKFQAFAGEVPVLNRGLGLLGNGYMLAGAGIAAVGAAMYKSADYALDYETAMAKVNATAQLTPDELARLKNELKEVGEESAGNFMRIPDAFEKINSQVNDTTKSLEILKVANKGAQAGFVDIDLAAGALAQTLSIVGKRDDAAGVMDTLLKAKKTGAGEFKDFAQYLPQLIASGDNLNIPYKDVSGLFAYMTAKGQNAADATMLMQNAFTAMSKSDIQQGFAKQGIKMFDKAGNMRDLASFFKELQNRLKHFNSQQKSNFLESVGLRDAQAKSAFSVLAGDADKLRSVLDDVRNSTGELNAQLDVTGNKARDWAQIGDKIKSALVAVGDWLLPIVDKMVWGAQNIYRTYTNQSTVENEGYWALEKQKKDEQLARDYAKGRMTKEFAFGPGMFENNNAKMNPKEKEKYDYYYKWDLAKLTGTAFGGDYDKFVADKKKAFSDVKTEKDVKKEDFSFTKKGKKSKELESGINSINDGGRSVRYVNVNFKNLVERIEMHPKTVNEGVNDMTHQLEEGLVRAINGAEMSLANE